MASASGEQLEHEAAVIAAVAERRDELVALASALIRYDTTAGDPAEPGRDEAVCQELLESRLRAAGAETDLWEPDPAGLARSRRQVPDGLGAGARHPHVAARVGDQRSKQVPAIIVIVDHEDTARYHGGSG